MSSLIASIEGMQKEVCQLGARNCKVTCENKLNEFKQRVKNCFSISSSLDEALKQAKSSQNDSVCYSDLKRVAESYKRLSLKGNSELREDLSVQDIVDCEGVRDKGKGAVGTKKAMELCSEANQELLVRQQQEQAEKEELERQEREKERLEELERQKEEEHRRKQEEFEDRARMIQADMGYTTNENNWFAFWHWKTDFLGGSWNIAFVHEEDLNSGTVVHELAHTLGEEKEHYRSAGEFCRRFKGSAYKPCHTYRVEKALDTRKENGKLIFQFVEKKFSIMNNRSGIKNQWMLRDTFQKIFKVLSKKAVIPPDEKLHADKSLYYYRKERRSSLKAVVSGFYDKKEQAFVLPQIKLRRTKLLTPSLYPQIKNTKGPVITFQLKEGKKILQTIKRPILKMQIKTLYKKKAPKIEDFDFSPAIAVFKLPEGFRDRKLRIDVLGEDKTIMLKRLIPIKVKKEKRFDFLK